MKISNINYIFLFFLLSLSIRAQGKRVLLKGVVQNNSSPIENVHIINLSAQKGSLSNKNGEFKISVKENDTLLFSDIQYLLKKMIITGADLRKEKISIELKPKNYKLDEIVLFKNKELTAPLGLPNADKKKLNKIERRLNYYSQKSTPMVFLDALLLSPILNFIPFTKERNGGIDDIYNIVSGNRKKDRTLKRLLDQDQLNNYNQLKLQEIRSYFTDDFFTQKISIPKEKINPFLNYCLEKNIIILFNRKRYLDITDIFIKESKGFLSDRNR